MSLRILLTLATLCTLPACDPAELADDATPLAADADLTADLDLTADADTAPIARPDALAPSCEAVCLDRSVRRCNGDSMGHCSDTAMLDEVLACFADECGVTDPKVEALEAQLSTVQDPVAASMCVNICTHVAGGAEFDCYAKKGTPDQCKKARTNSFNICYYDNCCSTWDQLFGDCTPPKL